MKKQLAVLAAACILLSGCASDKPENPQTQPAPAESISVIPMETLPPATVPPETETEAGTFPAETEALPLAPEAYQVTYSYLMDETQEFYTFQGLDPDKNIVWTLETAHLDCAQIPQVAPIGTMNGQFYYCEAGAVVALDAVTGQELWRNEDFGGCIATEDCVILDPSGFLYLSGYFGPDLFVLDTEGNTLKKVDHFDTDSYWPSGIRTEDGRLIVRLEGGTPNEFSLPMDWIPQSAG